MEAALAAQATAAVTERSAAAEFPPIAEMSKKVSSTRNRSPQGSSPGAVVAAAAAGGGGGGFGSPRQLHLTEGVSHGGMAIEGSPVGSPRVGGKTGGAAAGDGEGGQNGSGEGADADAPSPSPSPSRLSSHGGGVSGGGGGGGGGSVPPRGASSPVNLSLEPVEL